MLIGRPSIYTSALAADICECIASGESLRSVCRDEDMPALRTVTGWLPKYPEFERQYVYACEARTRAWAEEIIEIADGTKDDDPVAIQRDRLRARDGGAGVVLLDPRGRGLPPSSGRSRPLLQRFCRKRRSPATWCARPTNLKALANWRKRNSTASSSRMPTRPRSPVPNGPEDATSVASRVWPMTCWGLARGHPKALSQAVFLHALNKTGGESNLGLGWPAVANAGPQLQGSHREADGSGKSRRHQDLVRRAAQTASNGQVRGDRGSAPWIRVADRIYRGR